MEEVLAREEDADDSASTGDEGMEWRRSGMMGCQCSGSESRLFRVIKQDFCM